MSRRVLIGFILLFVAVGAQGVPGQVVDDDAAGLHHDLAVRLFAAEAEADTVLADHTPEDAPAGDRGRAHLTALSR